MIYFINVQYTNATQDTTTINTDSKSYAITWL